MTAGSVILMMVFKNHLDLPHSKHQKGQKLVILSHLQASSRNARLKTGEDRENRAILGIQVG